MVWHNIDVRNIVEKATYLHGFSTVLNAFTVAPLNSLDAAGLGNLFEVLANEATKSGELVSLINPSFMYNVEPLNIRKN